MRKQANIFRNPTRIISDRGTAFTSSDFCDYCKIEHILTTPGIPRANSQVERVNRTLISLLTKLSSPKPTEWYKYLEIVQQFLNTTLHRSMGTPFQLLFVTRAKLRDDPHIQEIIENELETLFQNSRDELRLQAKENIANIQLENKRNYNKKRKKLPYIKKMT